MNKMLVMQAGWVQGPRWGLAGSAKSVLGQQEVRAEFVEDTEIRYRQNYQGDSERKRRVSLILD